MHGKNLTESELSQSSNTSLTHGTRRDALVRIAKQHGFDVTSSSKGTWRDAVSLLKKGIPVLVNYREPTDDQGHYAIVIGFDELSVTFNDPWNGEQFSLPLKSFTCRWLGHRTRDPKWGWMMTLQPRKK